MNWILWAVLAALAVSSLVWSVPVASRALLRRRTGERPRLAMRPDTTGRRSSRDYTYEGEMYRPEEKAHHVCENKNQTSNGTIWICSCGRAYVQRSAHHSSREELRRDRKYWWRIRWYFPWHWPRAWIVRGLKRDRYLLPGMESV